MSGNIVTKTLKIKGMTCVSCERRIETKLQKTNGIISVKASFSKGIATISFDNNIISLLKIEKIIENLDYQVDNQNIPQNKTDISKIFGVAVIIFALYMIINRFGGFNIFNSFPQAKEGMGYGMLFLVGVLTSIHCVAMCGGINLSQCVTKNLSVSVKSNLRPSILYNLGRVISYTVFGALVGALGSVVSFSGTAKGIVQLLAGIFMVIMGLNMMNVFPWLRRFNLRMPKIFAKKINAEKRSNSPLYVGLLNGLMPCGPLQAMQLYALSTGSPIKGAIAMFLFSTGTVPLMFGLGALSSLLNKKFTQKMMTVSSVLVVVLGVFMFSSGMSLSGISFPSFLSVTKSSGTKNVAVIKGGIQEVTTSLASGRYQPITVQKGIPVKWTIKAEKSNINGCNNEMVIPKLNKRLKFIPGDNVMEFTPEQSGTISYSCWMGMIKSKITVVDDINNVNASENKASAAKIPTDKIAISKILNDEQTVEINMDDKGFSPAVIVVQKGTLVTWAINGNKITDGNSIILFPNYQASLNMKEGINQLRFTPESDFDFSTSDNAFFGYVKVVDDIKKIDIEAIKREVSAYTPKVQNIDDFDTGSGGAAPSCH